jgi:hypothetical protein
MPSNPSSVALTIRERIQREHDAKLRENTRSLFLIFYFWLALMVYLVLDSGATHLLGALLITVIGFVCSLGLFALLDFCGVTV